MKKKFYKRPIFIIIVIILVIMGIASSQSNNSVNTNTKTNLVNQETKTEETKKEAEKMKVEVTSQIVKKVDKKYRYFFDIRNNDTKPFEGKVSITLYNEKQTTALGGETFNTKQPMQPTIGNSVNFDIHTGPTSQHGEYGITKFKYSVKVNDVEVNSGEGTISDKFENLSL